MYFSRLGSTVSSRVEHRTEIQSLVSNTLRGGGGKILGNKGHESNFAWMMIDEETSSRVAKCCGDNDKPN